MRVDGETRRPLGEDFAAATILAQPFMVYFAVMRFRAPPTASQWAHVDPILRLLPPAPTLCLVPAFGVALTIAWLALAWPPWAVLGRSVLSGLAGAVLV